MSRYLILSLIVLIFLSCDSTTEKSLEKGIWRGELQVSDTEVLPFNFEVISPNSLKIFNADEVIEVDDIKYNSDTVRIQTPVFDGYIEAIHTDKKLSGNFIQKDLDRIVPFKAILGEEMRFKLKTDRAKYDVTGSWEAVFSPDSKTESYEAKGIFMQEGQKVTGTFRTTTGDYRYLEGVMDGSTMKLSAFDGAHAFLFTAEVNDDEMKGIFYSGNHWEEPFTAKRNDIYELPDANELTFLKEGYDSLEFTFPDSEGNQISLSDQRFDNKVVVVQIMGTWCPNCLDESRYYSDYYKNNESEDLEFVALAFEYAKTEEAAFNNINRLKDRLDISYPVLLAQYGSSSKEDAQEKLPMLNHVLSYPTSIFIDKTGKVRKIHTGFNGPATGEKYEEFKTEFTQFVNSLLTQ